MRFTVDALTRGELYFLHYFGEPAFSPLEPFTYWSQILRGFQIFFITQLLQDWFSTICVPDALTWIFGEELVCKQPTK